MVNRWEAAGLIMAVYRPATEPQQEAEVDVAKAASVQPTFIKHCVAGSEKIFIQRIRLKKNKKKQKLISVKYTS